MVLASCTTKTSSTTTTNTTTNTTTTTTKTTTAASTVTTTTVTTTSATGNWWDSEGTPQYGGEMVLQVSSDLSTWDVYNSPGSTNITAAYIEKTIGDDWTLNPSVYSYTTNWRPPDYVKGNLMESYEFTDPNTYVMHLRQGIHWQNIPPANGREFVAADVVFHYDRLLGLGDGFTTSNPFYAIPNNSWVNCLSVTAPDNYTVVMKWKNPNPEQILETAQGLGDENAIECPDAVKEWGNLYDWHRTIHLKRFCVRIFGHLN